MRVRFAAIFLAHWAPRLALLGALGGCVEPYAPEIIDAPNSFLVVDGFINGNGRTRIQLARTANVAATTAPPAEKGAKLFILDDAGTRYPLTEKTAGAYQSDSLLLSPARQYQLRIATAGNATYESARVALKVTPPIDQLGWRVQDDQVQLLLSTHDPAQAARYYRWGVAETWEFNSAYQSFLEYNRVKDDVVDRTTPIYTCWHTNRLSSIKQGSAAQLSQAALTDVELLRFPRQDERFKIRYSLLVSQYAETTEEFAYYELLRKNTEAVGTVNDPLPVQLTGNVRRTDANAAEPVLGYVGAHTVQQKRLFVTRAELPFVDFLQYDTPYKNCVVDTLKGAANDPNVVPISKTRNPDAILASSRDCVDCRQRGSNVKPSFW